MNSVYNIKKQKINLKTFFNIKKETTFELSEIIEIIKQAHWPRILFQIFYKHPFIRGVFCVTTTSKKKNYKDYNKLQEISNQVKIKQKRLYLLDLLRKYFREFQKALEIKKKKRQVNTIQVQLKDIDDLKKNIQESLNKEMEEEKFSLLILFCFYYFLNFFSSDAQTTRYLNYGDPSFFNEKKVVIINRLLYKDRSIVWSLIADKNYQIFFCHVFDLDIKIMEKIQKVHEEMKKIRKEVEGNEEPFEFTNKSENKFLIKLDAKNKYRYTFEKTVYLLSMKKLKNSNEFVSVQINQKERLLRQFDLNEKILTWWSDLKKHIQSFLEFLYNSYCEWVYYKYVLNLPRKYVFCHYEDEIDIFKIEIETYSNQNFDNIPKQDQYNHLSLRHYLFKLPDTNIEICSYCSYFGLNIPKQITEDAKSSMSISEKYDSDEQQDISDNQLIDSLEKSEEENDFQETPILKFCNTAKLYGVLSKFINIWKKVLKNDEEEFSDRFISYIHEENTLNDLLRIADECNKKPNSSIDYSNPKLKDVLHEMWNLLPLSKETRNTFESC